jgi:choline dehydrogenase-like flavoprotein
MTVPVEFENVQPVEELREAVAKQEDNPGVEEAATLAAAGIDVAPLDAGAERRTPMGNASRHPGLFALSRWPRGDWSARSGERASATERADHLLHALQVQLPV